MGQLGHASMTSFSQLQSVLPIGIGRSNSHTILPIGIVIVRAIAFASSPTRSTMAFQEGYHSSPSCGQSHTDDCSTVPPPSASNREALAIYERCPDSNRLGRVSRMKRLIAEFLIRSCRWVTWLVDVFQGPYSDA